ncbi:alkaline phosphatase family protein [Oscillatoria sp. CS-180]|uniref:alkaline phosphatase family protein n=1 Tax=Oscillatoria sp. CS-180 TaxID=3021720 RepID=UPI00232AE80A|nr:alkaline phosphatase family protein [Oscillatoria sp. CS-180]MDB9529342.1 alkaline phosphatase family protein [Oscillatoria sp. CS-180]
MSKLLSSPNTKSRVVVIGLDSADPDLIQLWAKEGRLPFIRSLLEKGSWARLMSTRGMFSDSPWPTFNTGVPPSKHGFYNFQAIQQGTTDIVRVGEHCSRFLPFWWLLRDAGKRVAIFDVPKTKPIPGIDGIQVAGWGEEYPLIEQSSLPIPLVEELTARFGRYPRPQELFDPSYKHEIKSRDTLLANVERKLKAIKFLQEQDDWDLFVTVFAEAHSVGHHFYHHHDDHHWAHDPERAPVLGQALPSTYIELDAALKELLDGRLDDTTVFLVSVHGITTNYSGSYLLQVVMEKLGYQVPPESEDDTNSKSVSEWVKERLIPSSLRQFINDKFVPQSHHDAMFSLQFNSGVDWQRTRAFFLPTEHFQGFVRINLQGREPEGIVPVSDYDATCQEICHELEQLVNPDTGNRAVKQAVPITKVYQGNNLYDLPDIVIQWAEDGLIHHLNHPKFGTVSGSEAIRKAQHSEDGFVIAAGQHIRPGASVLGASTMDLAPTILYLLEQAVPEDLDGRVLSELINEHICQGRPVQRSSQSLVVP